MPLYVYECESCGAKQETLRAMRKRNVPVECVECSGRAFAIMTLPAKRTDGIYSYDPNIGNPDKFEKWQEGE